MSEIQGAGERLEGLVDRHIILSQLFDEPRPVGRRTEPLLLMTTTAGKTVEDCLSDLVDRVLVSCDISSPQHPSLPQNESLPALKFFLAQAIMNGEQ